MQNDIPQDQLERIQQMVDGLLAAFHPLELAIPLETDSALTYRTELQPAPERGQ